MFKYLNIDSKNPMKVNLGYKAKELYHFTSKEAAQNILDSKSFWVTESSKLDDKSEILYYKEVLDECINILSNKFQDQLVTIDTNGELYFGMINYLKYFSDHFNDSLENQNFHFFILSLTYNDKNDYLWENYSKSDGAILKIKPEFILQNRLRNLNDHVLYTCGYVEYDFQSQLEIVYNSFIDCYLTFQSSLEKRAIYEIDSVIFQEIQKVLFMYVHIYSQYFKKADPYSKEMEYRVSFLVNKNASDYIKIRNFDTPYIEFKFEEDTVVLLNE